MDIGLNATRMGTVGTVQSAAHGEDAPTALKQGAEVGLGGAALEGGIQGGRAVYKSLTEAPDLASTIRNLAGYSEVGGEFGDGKTPALNNSIRVAAPDLEDIAHNLQFKTEGNARVGEFLSALRHTANDVTENGTNSIAELKRVGALNHIADVIESRLNNGEFGDVKRLGIKGYAQRAVGGALGGAALGAHVGPLPGAVLGLGEAALEDFRAVRNAPGEQLSRALQGIRDSLEISPEAIAKFDAENPLNPVHPFNIAPEKRPNVNDFTPEQLKKLTTILQENSGSNFHSGLPLKGVTDNPVDVESLDVPERIQKPLSENTTIVPEAKEFHYDTPEEAAARKAQKEASRQQNFIAKNGKSSDFRKFANEVAPNLPEDVKAGLRPTEKALVDGLNSGHITTIDDAAEKLNTHRNQLKRVREYIQKALTDHQELDKLPADRAAIAKKTYNEIRMEGGNNNFNLQKYNNRPGIEDIRNLGLHKEAKVPESSPEYKAMITKFRQESAAFEEKLKKYFPQRYEDFKAGKPLPPKIEKALGSRPTFKSRRVNRNPVADLIKKE